MAAPQRRPGVSTIFPVRVEDVLIANEVARYNERPHWAVLIRPLFELVAILVLIAAVTLPDWMTRPVISITFVLAAQIYWFRVRKWSRLLRCLFYVTVLLGFVLFSVGVTGVGVLVGALARFAYKLLMWLYYRRILITNRRVILVEGLLTAKVSMMPLTRVTDINYVISLAGTILRYGSVRVETAGQDQALSWIRYLARPAEFYDTLVNLSTMAVGSVVETSDTVSSDDKESKEPSPKQPEPSKAGSGDGKQRTSSDRYEWVHDDDVGHDSFEF